MLCYFEVRVDYVLVAGKDFAVGTFVWIGFVIDSAIVLRAVGVDVLLYCESVLEQIQL